MRLEERASAAVKRCSECEREYPVQALVCLGCEEILEETPYIKFVWIAVGVSLVLDVMLVKLGIFQRWGISEICQLIGLFVFVGYPILKIRQKLAEPKRPVLKELGSIYTSRFDRILILTMLILVPLVAIGFIAVPFAATTSVLVNPEHKPIYRAVAYFLGGLGLASGTAMILDQGWRFFDMRVKNTYVAREKARLS